MHGAERMHTHTHSCTGRISIHVYIRRSVGGRNRKSKFGEAKRDTNTYTWNMTFTLQIPWYPLYDGGEGANARDARAQTTAQLSLSKETYLAERQKPVSFQIKAKAS